MVFTRVRHFRLRSERQLNHREPLYRYGLASSFHRFCYIEIGKAFKLSMTHSSWGGGAQETDLTAYDPAGILGRTNHSSADMDSTSITLLQRVRSQADQPAWERFLAPMPGTDYRGTPALKLPLCLRV